MLVPQKHPEVATLRIIIKYLLKNICEKKLRTFLIMLAIVLSSGVFFGSTAISGSLTKSFTAALKGYFGNCDIVIRPSKNSPSNFFYTAGAERYGNDFEYVIGEISTGALYKTKKNEEVNIYLKGILLEDLQKMNPFSIEQQSYLYPFDGRKIIISSVTAGQYSLKLGDTITLGIGEGRFKFRISGIAAPTGHFKGSPEQVNAVVPRSTLSSIANARGKVNTAYIKLKDPGEKQRFIKKLSEEYKKYSVDEPFPYEMIKQQTSEISAIFMMLSSVVFFMSLFIIYSSFKVITAERLPVIGIFRSIGATGRITNLMLLGESMLYGTIGGVLGCGLGVGILYLMAYAMNNMASSGAGISLNTTIDFSVIHLVFTLLMAVVLCLMGSVIPIFKVSKISVKDIVLNLVQKTAKRKKSRLVLGIVFILVVFALSFSDSDNLRPIVAGLGMVLSLASLTMLVPYITAIFVRLFENVYSRIFGSIGVIAVKNLRDNRNIVNNITMLAIGISSLLMINTAGYDSAVSINDNYNNTKYDIEVYTGRADRNFARMILGIDGVKDVYGDYSFYHVELAGRKEYISEVTGIDKAKFMDFFKLDMDGDPKAAFDKLEEDRNILEIKYE